MTYFIHGTKKLLDRVKPVSLVVPPTSPSTLGNWYCTAIFWKPQVALFVCERTLLPVLMPLAPASELAPRFTFALFEVLHAHGMLSDFIDQELAHMNQVQYAKTANRSVVSIMNQFTFMAEVFRENIGKDDLLAISLKLATVPCGPLYKTGVSPDRELKRLVGELGFDSA
jgi:hypothetical protein